MNLTDKHSMYLEFPYALHYLDEYQLSYHAHARFSNLLHSEGHFIPADVADKIEEVIQLLKYINDHSPSDSDEVPHKLQSD